MVVGSYLDDIIRPGQGSAYVFAETAGVWSRERRLYNPNPFFAGCMKFGYSVAIDGQHIAIGEPYRDYGVSLGAVWTYVLDGDSWRFDERLVPETHWSEGLIGLRVALDSGRLALSAPAGHGEILTYRRGAAGWTEEARVLGRTARRIGYELDLDGSTIVQGGGVSDPNGSVSTFELVPVREALSFYCTAKTNSCGWVPALETVGSPSASAEEGFEVTARFTRFGRAGVLLYSTRGRAALPFDGGWLCVDPSSLHRAVSVPAFSADKAACSGILTIDMNAFAAGALGGNPRPDLRVPGTQVYAQWWSLDSPAHGALLSNAVTYPICP